MKVNTTTALRNFTQDLRRPFLEVEVSRCFCFLCGRISPQKFIQGHDNWEKQKKTKKTKKTHLIFENFGAQFQKKICVGEIPPTKTETSPNFKKRLRAHFSEKVKTFEHTCRQI